MVVSEVTARKEEVKVGTSLWYIDSCNCAKWYVTEVNEDYFVVVDEYGYEFTCIEYVCGMVDSNDEPCIDIYFADR